MRKNEGAPHEETFFALDELFRENPARLAHMRDVSAFAGDFARSCGISDANRELLERAALLHDIGYAPALRHFAYHPLDGACFLSSRGEHPWVVEGVLRHSLADRKAAGLPGIAEEYAARPRLPEAAWLVRAVTIADWRAAGVGGRTSFAQRVRDIEIRNPDKPGKCARAREMVVEVRNWFLDWARDMAGERPLPWVFCDIDSTLISPGAPLSETNRQAVRAYVSAGGRFSMASGKHARSVAMLAQEMGLGDPQIGANGTCLVEDGRITVLAHLGEMAEPLRARLESLGLPLALYHAENIESGGCWEGWLSDVFARYGELRPESGGEGPVVKILCVADEDNSVRDAEIRRIAEELGVLCCRSDKHFLEFVPDQGDKGAAVRTVVNATDWPFLHTVALGDNENDTGMFAWCGTCAAVVNAQDSALLGADWRIPACAENGVGWMLDRLRARKGWPAFTGLPVS